MIKPDRFRAYCELFVFYLEGVNVGFLIQTNGVLINEEWIQVFKDYKVCVGVSIDGPEAENDKYRLSNSGEGTYAKTVAGLKKLQQAFEGEYAHLGPSVISVINPLFDYKKIFKHIHLDLKVNTLSFLLPDCQHDTGLPIGSTAERYGDILCDILDAWDETGQKANVRQLDDLFSHFQMRRPEIEVAGEIEDTKSNQIIVVQSDGSISIDDTYMVALEWRNAQETPNVSGEELKTYLSRPIILEIDDLNMTLPETCQSCCWANICKGGDLENRYSRKNGFNNPSVFCGGLKTFYAHTISHLINNGYPQHNIEDFLFSNTIRKKFFLNAVELID